MTDACENVTFPQLLLRMVINRFDASAVPKSVRGDSPRQGKSTASNSKHLRCQITVINLKLLHKDPALSHKGKQNLFLTKVLKKEKGFVLEKIQQIHIEKRPK